MRDETYWVGGKELVRVSKAVARKHHEQHKIVCAAPVNVNMNYWGGLALAFVLNSEADFDIISNEISYYNCNYELGRYLKYFVEGGN